MFKCTDKGLNVAKQKQRNINYVSLTAIKEMVYNHVSHLVFVNKTASKISIRRNFTGFEEDILRPKAVDTIS